MGCNNASVKFSIAVAMMARQSTDDSLRFSSHVTEILATRDSSLFFWLLLFLEIFAIQTQAFWRCSAFTGVSIPAPVEALETGCSMDCKSMIFMTVQAFHNCGEFKVIR
jgi:hypothetical protein